MTAVKRQGKQTQRLGLFALGVCVCAFSLPAASQGTGNVLEEIIVTAQKRDESMQDVPIALSVVTASELENRSIVNFAELFQLMPNTTIDLSIASIPRIAIRGVSSNTNNIGIESGVGVAVDEVFLGRPSAFSTNLIDIERVEVLRGPQGTLFGKNTIGGLVNVVTRKPTMEAEGAFDLTYGENDLMQARGYFSGPIMADRLAGKLSVTVKQQDGWVENRNPDAQDLNGTDFWGLRGQLFGKFGDSGSWLLSAEYSEDDSPENYLDVLSGPFTAFDDDPFDRSIATSENDTFTREIYGASLQIDWTWGNFDFVSITAARGVDWTGRNDQDYSIIRIFESGRTELQDQISQEFRMLGGNDTFDWIAGLYFFDQTQEADGPLLLDGDLPVFFGATGPGDPLAPFWEPYQETATTVSAIDTQSVAAFVSGNYNINDAWTLSGGVRYTSEDKDFAYEQQNEVFELFPGVPVNFIGLFFPPVPPSTSSRSDSDWSGDVSLSYAFTDDVNSYLKLSRGFKAGGFDSTLSDSTDPGNLEFDSETLVNYELGFKSTVADDKVRFNVAIFHSDYQDKQEQFFNGSVFVINNAASATIDGFEADLAVIAGSYVQIEASLGVLNAKYDDYLDPVTLVDNSGNDLPGISDLTASLTFELHNTHSNGWSWLFRTDGAYKSEAFLQPSNDPDFVRDAATLVNARFAVSSPNDRYTIAAWMKNVLDRDFIRAKQANPGLFTEWVGLNEPRMWGLEFRMNFGNR